MAGGKLTPRQKMINLMYLVFIAMLALNMSKEVLSAFGILNNDVQDSNRIADVRNKSSFDQLAQKASEQPLQYGAKKEKVAKLREIGNELSSYIDDIKSGAIKGFELDEDGNLPFEQMDKGDYIDGLFWKGDKETPKAKEFVEKLRNYVRKIKEVGGKDIADSEMKKIEKRFNTDDVKSKKAEATLSWLDYNYKGFPLIASITKLSQLQAKIKSTEGDIMAGMFQSDLIAAASLTKYQPIVVLDKSVFFSGEAVTGKVILGKFDEELVAKSVVVNGSSVAAQAGQAKFSFGAGNVGEHKISGSFNFDENNKVVSLPIEGNYVVVNRPKTANIAADKMNVVYRDLDNPMTVSFAGVPDSDVSASAPGMTKVSGNGKYNLRPKTGSEIVINVTGKLSDGSTVSDKKTYRIKDIPGPTGTIGGDMGIVKGPISRLENSQIGALIPGFDFDVKLNVNAFNLKVTGQPTVVVTGNRLNAQAKSVLKKVQRGDQVTISEIKTTLVGSTMFLPRTNIVIFEVN
jgi:gliding motility-associated protein GldM